MIKCIFIQWCPLSNEIKWIICWMVCWVWNHDFTQSGQKCSGLESDEIKEEKTTTFSAVSSHVMDRVGLAFIQAMRMKIETSAQIHLNFKLWFHYYQFLDMMQKFSRQFATRNVRESPHWKFVFEKKKINMAIEELYCNACFQLITQFKLFDV